MMGLRVALLLSAFLWSTCMESNTPQPESPFEEQFRRLREQMVLVQIEERGVRDKRVLQAMRKTPRHLFVPDEYKMLAYRAHPLAIGFEQTISQPYIVAYMTEQLQLAPGDKVLEIGTGSGYQAAVLAELVDQVYSIEIIEPLCRQAQDRLKRLHYDRVSVRCGDGYVGWPEAAPFDAIILTAAPASIPETLVAQLAVNGRMILPVGEERQELVLIEKSADGSLHHHTLLPVRFVPMTGGSHSLPEDGKK